MITPIDKYPIILGKKYEYSEDGTLATLISADLKTDEFELGYHDSIWRWKSNYSSFTYYWKLKDEFKK